LKGELWTLQVRDRTNRLYESRLVAGRSLCLEFNLDMRFFVGEYKTYRCDVKYTDVGA